MITTAEKIKVMQAFEDGAQIQYKTRFQNDNMWSDLELHYASEPVWNWDLNEYRIKHPNPQPFECWIAHQGISIIGASKSEPEVTGRVQKTLVREVTPEMLENEKDAARYRQAKKERRNCVTLISNILAAPTDKWDELLDKAMEEEAR